MGDQSGGVRIASSFHCSDGRYVILKQAFFWHHFQERNTRSVLYSLSLSWTHKTLLWNETLVDPWQAFRKQLNSFGGFKGFEGVKAWPKRATKQFRSPIETASETYEGTMAKQGAEPSKAAAEGLEVLRVSRVLNRPKTCHVAVSKPNRNSL